MSAKEFADQIKGVYEAPTLTRHGSVALLTGKPGSDIDGNSGMQGNASMSDTIGGGCNAGCP